MKREFHLTQEFHSNDEIKAAHLELDAYMTGSDKVWSFSVQCRV